MENKTESHVTYDDRRKEMVQHFNSIQDIKIGDKVIGESVTNRKATFKEEGIRNVIKELNEQQIKFEKTIKQLKDNLKNIPEITPEIKELEKKIQTINDFNKSKQMKSQIETTELDLKIVRKDIRDIKEAIGSRLKL